MSASDQHPPDTAQVPRLSSSPVSEALLQIARDMSKVYEMALEVDPQLYFSGRTPALADRTH